jgi:cytosine/adenosine deaminase-related metal-dependent hydrolase
MGAPARAATTGAPPRANATTAGPPRNRPVILHPSWTLAWEAGSFKLLRDHSIVVEHGRIVEISPVRRRVRRDFNVWARGQLLLPGLISGHTHTTIVSAARGIVGLPGKGGAPIRTADLLDADDRYDLTLYRLAESLRGGCTTRFEQALSLEQAKSHLRAAKELETREYLSAMTPGWSRLFPIWQRSNDQVLFDSEPETLAEIEAIRAWSVANNNAEGGRIRMQMGPHAPNTHTPATMRAIAAAAKELGNGIHMHLSQDAREINDIQRLYGKRPTEWIDEFGFYDDGLLAAHLRGMDPVIELPILKEKEATFGYCPWEGGIAGTTVPRWWPEVLAAGVNSSIGLEFSNDYIESMKMAVFYGGARFSLLPHPAVSPVPLKNPTIWDAMRASTVNGAAIRRRDDLGRIEVGARADLASVDVTGYFVGSPAVPPQPVYNLLYANGKSVVNVMTDGVLQVHNGRLLIADERRIAERAGRVMEKLWAQAAAEGWFNDATG